MRSPLSPIPSLGGRRRKKLPPTLPLLVAVPRISPERELATLRALMKPQTAHAVVNRLDDGTQPWPKDGAERIAKVSAAADRHLGVGVAFHLPDAGEYHALATLAPEPADAALSVGLLLSDHFPDTWVVAGRLFVRNGQFFRRERGIKLNLRPANDVHLSKPARASLREAIRTGGHAP